MWNLKKGLCLLSRSVVSDSLQPHGCQGSSVHGILQARTLERVVKFPSLGDLPDPGTEPRSLALQAASLPSEPPEKPWERAAVQKSYFKKWLSEKKKTSKISKQLCGLSPLMSKMVISLTSTKCFWKKEHLLWTIILDKFHNIFFKT